MLLFFFFFFSSRRRHTRWNCDWSSDVCSSDLGGRPRRAALRRSRGGGATVAGGRGAGQRSSHRRGRAGRARLRRRRERRRRGARAGRGRRLLPGRARRRRGAAAALRGRAVEHLRGAGGDPRALRGARPHGRAAAGRRRRRYPGRPGAPRGTARAAGCGGGGLPAHPGAARALAAPAGVRGACRGWAMRILTAEEMRGVDRAAIERLGLPGLVLMENAALGVVDAIGRQYPRAESAAIFCGPGNNGGDGLAVARQLATRGYAVEIFLAAGKAGQAGEVGRAGQAGETGEVGKAGERQLSGDAGLQLAVCRRLELTIHELAPDGDAAAADAGLAAALHDLVIDALFGTGLARPLAGWYARLVEGLNEVPRPRVAVDIPSGLSGSRAEPPGPHLVADLTVTFAAPKVAHVFPPAADAAGELVVADLGFPRRLVDEAAGDLHLLVGEELCGLLPPRARDSHKGDFGHLLLVAGSVGKARSEEHTS